MAFIPNTTPTPNWLYDEEMRKMTETELKVVLLVTRKTLGWFEPMTLERKTQDNISQSQFMKFTGKSHTAVAQAIQSSVENGWIIAKDNEGNLCDTPEKRRRKRVWYQLGGVFIGQISKQQSGQDEENLSNISATSKQQSGQDLSKKVDNTKETITKENITKLAKQSFAGNEIAEIISLFKEVNPSIEKYYNNTTQRAAVERMLKVYGREKLEIIIKALPAINARPYWKKSTTPLQLENNIPEYKAKQDEEKQKAEKKSKFVFL